MARRARPPLCIAGSRFCLPIRGLCGISEARHLTEATFHGRARVSKRCVLLNEVLGTVCELDAMKLLCRGRDIDPRRACIRARLPLCAPAWLWRTSGLIGNVAGYQAACVDGILLSVVEGSVVEAGRCCNEWRHNIRFRLLRVSITPSTLFIWRVSIRSTCVPRCLSLYFGTHEKLYNQVSLGAL